MKTILVVDDEYAIASGVVTVLAEDGYEVVTASNGQEALARVAERRPDLVISDVMMPIMTGLELIDALAAGEATRSIPVLLMSGMRRGALERRVGGELRCAVFLRKPFAIEDLVRAVHELIGP